MSKTYETVIGLEVHVELATKTKIFCSCSTEFGGKPNSHTCPVCTGMPGSLPVLNKQVVEYAMAVGLATNCKITQYCKFDRKNYFYPDNPQNYQISQLYLPICRDGGVEIETASGKKIIGIHEIHMEEDAGKLVHDEWEDVSIVDYNRSGVPLIEIVSEPDMRSAEEVIAYLEKLRLIIQYLGASDCKLNEGSMRADVNLSVREAGAAEFGTRTEMKNLNSFKAIARAIEGERKRQIELIEEGKKVIQETRRWDDNKESSHAMRSKEDAQDYRYFPDPDLMPVWISDEWIQSRTGIRERRISEGADTAELAAGAAKAALENAGVSADDVDLILVATSTPDHCFPNAACMVQAAIGAERAVAYDISAACSGFLFAVNTAHAFLGSGIYKTALVIGADTLSKIVDWSDRSTCVLFGDGAGAAVLRVEEGEKSGIFAMKMGSDGKKGPVLSCVSRTIGNFLTNTEPQIGYTTMDGQEVFKFAVKKVPETIKELLDENGLEPKDVKHYVLHQANYRIAEAIAKRLKVSMEQIPTNMEHYGNTSGASIPLLLDELNRAGKIQKGDLLVLAGFGAGLTWGATLVRW